MTAAKKRVAIAADQTTAMSLIDKALTAGVDVDKLERLMDLAERQSAEVARQQWHQAMSNFQSHCPVIPRTKRAGNYSYAPLDTIMQYIRKPLADAGLSVIFDETCDGELRHTTCRVVHVAGHSETATFSGPAQVELRGGANRLQQSGGAQSYGRRYSLIMALNLTSADEDADSVRATQEQITAEQIADIDALIDEVKADRAKLLQYCRVEDLSELPASKFQQIIRLLEAKR